LDLGFGAVFFVAICVRVFVGAFLSAGFASGEL
jgi:hypothetical protein